MAFVSFSSSLVIDNATAVSNVFMEEYLPKYNGDAVRVYLYGLYMCGSGERYDNTLEHFSVTLGLPEDDIISAFLKWQELGLVTVLSTNPLEVKYLPVASGASTKKYDNDKFADFNAQIQAVIDKRMITPNEFSQYYDFLNDYHVEPAALVMIAKHCVNIKGPDVGYIYILTVARNWANSGIKTVPAVDERLKQEAAPKEGKRGRNKKVVNITRHSYTDEDFAKMVTDIDEVEF